MLLIYLKNDKDQRKYCQFSVNTNIFTVFLKTITELYDLIYCGRLLNMSCAWYK